MSRDGNDFIDVRQVRTLTVTSVNETIDPIIISDISAIRHYPSAKSRVWKKGAPFPGCRWHDGTLTYI